MRVYRPRVDDPLDPKKLTNRIEVRFVANRFAIIARAWEKTPAGGSLCKEAPYYERYRIYYSWSRCRGKVERPVITRAKRRGDGNTRARISYSRNFIRVGELNGPRFRHDPVARLLYEFKRVAITALTMNKNDIRYQIIYYRIYYISLIDICRM